MMWFARDKRSLQATSKLFSSPPTAAVTTAFDSIFTSESTISKYNRFCSANCKDFDDAKQSRLKVRLLLS